jgi:hypothetical protein
MLKSQVPPTIQNKTSKQNLMLKSQVPPTIQNKTSKQNLMLKTQVPPTIQNKTSKQNLMLKSQVPPPYKIKQVKRNVIKLLSLINKLPKQGRTVIFQLLKIYVPMRKLSRRQRQSLII